MPIKNIFTDLDGNLVSLLKGFRLNPLSAAERTALGAQLGLANIGLPVFDSTDPILYFWNGTQWVSVGGSYTLPKASAVTLGGIKVGDNLTIESDGTLNASGSAAVLANDLTVNIGSGNNIGGINDQDLFPAGTLLETIVDQLFTVAVHPAYVAPTLVLAGNNQTLEVGSIISPTFSITYTQHDAGTTTAQRLIRVPTTISTTFPYTDTNYQVPEGTTQYKAEVDYSTGPIKNNNLGVPDAVGRILAGTKTSNIITVVGYRNALYGALTGAAPTTSAQVRALPNSLLDPAGKDYILTIPVGTVNVVFAIPNTLTLQYVQYIELSNSDVKAAFTHTSVSVQGASGYAAINYNVYVYTPVEPFTVAVHYRIKAQ